MNYYFQVLTSTRFKALNYLAVFFRQSYKNISWYSIVASSYTSSASAEESPEEAWLTRRVYN